MPYDGPPRTHPCHVLAPNGPVFELDAWQYYTNPLVQSGVGAFYLNIGLIADALRWGKLVLSYHRLPSANTLDCLASITPVSDRSTNMTHKQSYALAASS